MSMLDRPISEFDGPGRLGAHPGGAADGRLQAVPGGAGRAREPAQASRPSSMPTARASTATTRTSSSTTRPRRAPASASSPAGAARTARSRCAASRIRSSGRCTRRTTASSSTTCRRACSTCATGTATTWSGRSRLGLRRDLDPIVIHIYSEFLQRFRLAAQGKRPGKQPPERLRAARRRPTSTRCRSGTRRSRRRQTDTARYPLQRGDAAADGDVPLVGLAERLAAPDPHPQLPDREHAHRARRRHRRRRLDVGRIAVGQGALPVPAHRGGRAGHGVDLERDRQGVRRVEPRARRQRVAAGFPAQPPDRRGAAGPTTGRRGSRTPTP